MLMLARTALAAIVVCLLSVPALAGSDSPVQVSYAATAIAPAAPQDVSIDQELASKRVDFEDFAQWKVRQLNSNHLFSREHMEVVKLDDGSYRARYHEIDSSTLSYKVRRSDSRSIPFVGVLSYREQVFEASADSPEAFEDDSFVVVQVIPNRHIFSYRKGAWN